jgi:type I restriction enzyme, S subunit
MSLKQFTTDFQELGKEISFRHDFDFLDFQREFLVEQYYSFEDLFDFSIKNKVDIGKIDNDFFYVEIGNVSKDGDIEPVKLSFNKRKEEEENYYKKIEKGDIIRAKKGDILIAKVRPNLKKCVFINEENQNYFYTSAFVHLVPKKLNKIFYYSFRTIFYENLIAISRQGKGYPTLKEEDFYYLKFDKKLVNKLFRKEDQIVAEIEPIEKEIKKFKNQITPPQEIINKVFAREFSFDLEKFKELKKEKFFDVEFCNISNFPSLRNGVKNYKDNYNYLFDFLKSIPTISLSKIFGDIKNSTAPELDNEGNNKVVKIAQLKNGFIDYENCESVSDKFFEKNKKQLKIKEEDIFIVNRGVGSIGKVDLCEQEPNEEYLIGGSIYILRSLSEKFDHRFITYFLRSVQGYYQMEFGFFGNTNQIALYLPILNDIKIPNISLKSQQKIVDGIKTELDKQEEMKKKIEAQRNKIDEIIEKAIR